ncbi:YcgN family cysteine cluster protein [Bisbaumannia pacifica]|uniref:YcgN family cysteine cluster protein n=1 Tax=Bisbaumannia pacifica TaxID=77098 RepID=A0ABD4L2P6_9GAMM|nr:YcgN family cysteine cluster protein [Halomonas pacifica]MBH8580990.1 YcgN family cysteine cluster protein [Halomonas pacifica]
MRERFWERYPLHELTAEEWEALCDGCGQCCLLKLEDADTGQVAVLNVACELLDIPSCRCGDYANRFARVPGCTRLTLERVEQFRWLPHSCAYRRLYEGRKLAAWHPLNAGDDRRLRRKGIDVSSFAVSQREVPEEYLEDHIIAVLPIDD